MCIENKVDVEVQLIIEIAKNIIEPESFKPNTELLKEINWKKLYIILSRHKIFLLIYEMIKKYIPEEYKKIFLLESLKIRATIKNYLEELENVVEAMDKHNEKFLLIKGLALSKILYDDLYKREFGDLDIMVDEKSLIYVKSYLNEIDYLNSYEIEGKVLQIKEPSNSMLGIFHEFSFAKYINQGYLWIDLKCFSSAISKKHISDFNKNVMLIDVNGHDMLTYNYEHTFLHLCSNTYGNSERAFCIEGSICMRDFIDVYVFLSRYNNILNWKKIQSLGKKYELTNKIYYSLTKINEIFGDYVDDSTIELFNEKNKQYGNCTMTQEATIVKWDSTIIERLFMGDAARFVEYSKLYFERQYSAYNRRLKEVYNVQNCCLENAKILKESMLCSTDSQISFDYAFFLNPERKRYIIRMFYDCEQRRMLQKSFVDFDFYTSHNNYKPIVIRTFFTEDGIYLSYGNRIIILEERKSNDKYVLDIDIEQNFLNKYFKDTNVPYNIYVFKVPYSKGNPIIVGVKYGLENDMEESPDLGFLNLGNTNNNSYEEQKG